VSSIKISPQQHLKHPWQVHALCADFELEDVWRVPVELGAQHSLQIFMDQFKKTEAQLLKKGAAGWLFKLRLALGKLFGWDAHPDPNREGSIRLRYAQQQGLTVLQLPHPGSGSFVPVYQLENEFLSEIENDTVHATLHFGRVPLRENVWGIQMAVQVKPKGWFGKGYMLLIKPFRLWVVYPAMMRSASKMWKQFLASQSQE
jgi:Protein of unknown function (DUF2867)